MNQNQLLSYGINTQWLNCEILGNVTERKKKMVCVPRIHTCPFFVAYQYRPRPGPWLAKFHCKADCRLHDKAIVGYIQYYIQYLHLIIFNHSHHFQCHD